MRNIKKTLIFLLIFYLSGCSQSSENKKNKPGTHSKKPTVTLLVSFTSGDIGDALGRTLIHHPWPLNNTFVFKSENSLIASYEVPQSVACKIKTDNLQQLHAMNIFPYNYLFLNDPCQKKHKTLKTPLHSITVYVVAGNIKPTTSIIIPNFKTFPRMTHTATFLWGDAVKNKISETTKIIEIAVSENAFCGWLLTKDAPSKANHSSVIIYPKVANSICKNLQQEY